MDLTHFGHSCLLARVAAAGQRADEQRPFTVARVGAGDERHADRRRCFFLDAGADGFGSEREAANFRADGQCVAERAKRAAAPGGHQHAGSERLVSTARRGAEQIAGIVSGNHADADLKI